MQLAHLVVPYLTYSFIRCIMKSRCQSLHFPWCETVGLSFCSQLCKTRVDIRTRITFLCIWNWQSSSCVTIEMRKPVQAIQILCSWLASLCPWMTMPVASQIRFSAYPPIFARWKRIHLLYIKGGEYLLNVSKQYEKQLCDCHVPPNHSGNLDFRIYISLPLRKCKYCSQGN